MIGELIEIFSPKIKDVINGWLFLKSDTHKSIEIDINNAIDKYDLKFKEIIPQMIKGLNLEDKQNQVLISFTASLEDSELLDDIDSFSDDESFNEIFNPLDIKGKSFGKILREESKHYKTGANRDLLIKEKNILIIEIKTFLINFVSIGTDQMSKEIGQPIENNIKEEQFTPIIEVIDQMLSEIIDRICIKQTR